MTKRLHNPLDRFEARVLRHPGLDACWEWTGSTAKGYGMFWPDGREGGKVYAHRWAYEHWVGAVPKGLTLDHLCHTRDLSCDGGPGGVLCPHRRCVNPAHLEPVTMAVNLRRGRRWVERADGVWECKKGHAIHESYVKGKNGCPTCFDLYLTAWKRTPGSDGLTPRDRESAARTARRVAEVLDVHPCLAGEVENLPLAMIKKRLSCGWTCDWSGWTSPRRGHVPFVSP